MFKAAGDVMREKDADHTQGLAERSLNTSIVPPSQTGTDHQEQGDRILTENDQREGLEKTDSDRSKAEDRPKP